LNYFYTDLITSKGSASKGLYAFINLFKTNQFEKNKVVN